MLPDPQPVPRSRRQAEPDAPMSPEYHEAFAHRLLAPSGRYPIPTSQEIAQAQAHATLAMSLRLGAVGCNGIEVATR